MVSMFDEPICALDADTISGVLTVMVELAKAGMTIICITHEMGYANPKCEAGI